MFCTKQWERGWRYGFKTEKLYFYCANNGNTILFFSPISPHWLTYSRNRSFLFRLFKEELHTLQNTLIPIWFKDPHTGWMGFSMVILQWKGSVGSTSRDMLALVTVYYKKLNIAVDWRVKTPESYSVSITIHTVIYIQLAGHSQLSSWIFVQTWEESILVTFM